MLVKLPAPTADPVSLTRAAHRLLPLIEDGGRYARAGIALTDLRPAAASQSLELFRYVHEESGIPELIDKVQEKEGPGNHGPRIRRHAPRPVVADVAGNAHPRATTHRDELAILGA